MTKARIVITLAGAFAMAPHAWAASVPVLDVTQQEAPASSSDTSANAGTSIDQRMTILERQMRNLTQMDLLAQINKLQQDLQNLRGKLEVQKHEVQQLTEQLRTQYQDLDQRLKQPKANEPLQTLPSAARAAQPAVVASSQTEAPQPLSDTSLQEQKAYQAAYTLLRNHDYLHAKTKLQTFLRQYPEGAYAGNAHYWLGEIYLIQGQPDPAATEFNIVISKYPTNAKISDAMLKLGFAYYDKGDFAKAREQLSEVRKKYPGTSSAQLALTRLQQLKQQGK